MDIDNYDNYDKDIIISSSDSYDDIKQNNIIIM